jgi:hypothetical protein
MLTLDQIINHPFRKPNTKKSNKHKKPTNPETPHRSLISYQTQSKHKTKPQPSHNTTHRTTTDYPAKKTVNNKLINTTPKTPLKTNHIPSQK